MEKNPGLQKKDYCVLGYDIMQAAISFPTFWKRLLTPSAGYNSKLL
jgi:hypothetical protein